jgi:enoyl-CoA hydratase/carnithine racemase
MTVHATRRGRILVITMDRPAKRNALDAEMTAGLDAALNLLEDDPELWAGVLTGTASIFSAGTDLAVGAGEPTERGGEYGVVRRRRGTPLIAAIEGGAYGGGLELAMACDLVVAARGAALALPEVTRGVIATCGALFRAPRSLPLNVARELLLTGDPIPAERAHALGFVNVLVEPGETVTAAVALAERICRNAPTSVRSTMRAIDETVSADDDLGWAATGRAMALVMASADSAEGIQAFLDRRQPEWLGR